MMVFIRPTGSPVGQTLGFGPNGSAASLDTAPVVTTLAATDYVLAQSAGALVKLTFGDFPAPPLTASALLALLETLPTTLPATAGQLWLNGGVLSVS